MLERDDIPTEPYRTRLYRTRFEAARTICSAISAVGVLVVLARAFL